MTARLKQPLHQGMGPAVLAHLSRLAPLPSEGVVAGQAVASALQDLYGIGAGVYNDIDVFVPVTYPASEEKLVLMPRRFRSNLTIYPDNDGEYSEGLNRLVHTAGPTYSIVGTRKEELINTVHVRMGIDLTSRYFAVRLLDSFDINSTRVAVDIATGRLVWDKHFAQFCQDSVLRLCALHTPFHSLLRMYAKSEQLVDVTTNWAAAHQMVALTREPRLRAVLEQRKAVSYWFGSRYQALAMRYRTQLKNAFQIRRQWRFRDENGKVRPGFGDETLPAAELGTLRPRGGLPDELTGLVQGGLVDLLQLPKVTYAQLESANASYKGVRNWEPRALKNPTLAGHAELFGPGYFAQIPSLKAAQGLGRLLQSMGPTLLPDMAAHQQLHLLQVAITHLEHKGVLDISDQLRHTVPLLSVDDAELLRLRLDEQLEKEVRATTAPLPSGWNLDAQALEIVGTLGSIRKGALLKLEVLPNLREINQFRARHNLTDFFYFSSEMVYVALTCPEDPLQVCLLRWKTSRSVLVDNGLVQVPRKMGAGRRKALRRAIRYLESNLTKQGVLFGWDASLTMF